MKKDDLIRVIREIVRQEIRKELPTALTQVFSNLMGKVQPSVPPKPNTIKPTEKPPETQTQEEELDETATLKAQLQEMFNEGVSVRRVAQQVPQKTFAKDPVLNEVLNQTRPFNSSERMAMRAGGGLAMSPGVTIAAAGFNASPGPSTTGVGEMMSSEDLGFLNKIPTMPGADVPVVSEIPVGRVQLGEGQEGGPAPLESIGQISALDIKNHPALSDNIKGILNRDYRSLVRAMNKKK